MIHRYLSTLLRSASVLTYQVVTPTSNAKALPYTLCLLLYRSIPFALFPLGSIFNLPFCIFVHFCICDTLHFQLSVPQMLIAFLRWVTPKKCHGNVYKPLLRYLLVYMEAVAIGMVVASRDGCSAASPEPMGDRA